MLSLAVISSASLNLEQLLTFLYISWLGHLRRLEFSFVSWSSVRAEGHRSEALTQNSPNAPFL